MKAIITGIFIFVVVMAIAFLSGCTEQCDSGLFTSDSKCCTYVCTDKACPNGYEKDTCGCECTAETTTPTTVENTPTTTGDTNIDDIFDDTDDINPPVLPI